MYHTQRGSSRLALRAPRRLFGVCHTYVVLQVFRENGYSATEVRLSFACLMHKGTKPSFDVGCGVNVLPPACLIVSTKRSIVTQHHVVVSVRSCKTYFHSSPLNYPVKPEPETCRDPSIEINEEKKSSSSPDRACTAELRHT